MVAEACGMVGGVVMLALLYRLFFSDLSELGDALRFWITPDIVSMFRGEFAEDFFAEAKLGLWIAISGIVGFGVYAVVADMIASG